MDEVGSEWPLDDSLLDASEFAKKYEVKLTPKIVKIIKDVQANTIEKLSLVRIRATEERRELHRIQSVSLTKERVRRRLYEVTEMVKVECKGFEGALVEVDELTGLPVVKVTKEWKEKELGEVPVLIMKVSASYFDPKKRERSIGYGFAKRGKRWVGATLGFSAACKKAKWTLSVGEMIEDWEVRVSDMLRRFKRERDAEAKLKKAMDLWASWENKSVRKETLETDVAAIVSNPVALLKGPSVDVKDMRD